MDVSVKNEVTGTSGTDVLTGMSGMVNYLSGGDGNDMLIGKDRADVAVYTGNRSDYTVTTVAGVVTVTDNRPGSPDGTDTLQGINILQFADNTLFVTQAANRVSLTGGVQIYVVANSEFVTGTASAEHFIINPLPSLMQTDELNLLLATQSHSQDFWSGFESVFSQPGSFHSYFDGNNLSDLEGFIIQPEQNVRYIDAVI